MILRRAVVRLAIAFSAGAVGVRRLRRHRRRTPSCHSRSTATRAVPPTPPGEFDAADHALERLRVGLLLVYGVLILVIPLVSYVMARLALAPVRRNYELQEQFIDAASHEFRTPLGVAVGELSLALTRERSQEEYRIAIARSLEAVDGLSTLTNQLLLLSRGDTASLEAEREVVAVADLLREARRRAPANVGGAPAITTDVSARALGGGLRPSFLQRPAQRDRQRLQVHRHPGHGRRRRDRAREPHRHLGERYGTRHDAATNSTTRSNGSGGRRRPPEYPATASGWRLCAASSRRMEAASRSPPHLAKAPP